MADSEHQPSEMSIQRQLDAIRARTPARIFVGRNCTSYRTSTLLDLRADHASALDSVRAELDLNRDLGAEFVTRWGLFQVGTLARTKDEYLARPDLGRRLDEGGRPEVSACCRAGVDLQVVIGDGLSASAVVAQVPALLPLIAREAESRGWSFGRPFAVRHCRVGVLNDLGTWLDPVVAVLLIGERPGLSAADSLSAYMAYRPRPEHTDADRNLISNIHARGVAPEEAATRLVALADQMRGRATSGVAIKELGQIVGSPTIPPASPAGLFEELE